MEALREYEREADAEKTRSLERLLREYQKELKEGPIEENQHKIDYYVGRKRDIYRNPAYIDKALFGGDSLEKRGLTRWDLDLSSPEKKYLSYLILKSSDETTSKANLRKLGTREGRASLEKILLNELVDAKVNVLEVEEALSQLRIQYDDFPY